ncbi:putative 2OG-Fe(II) oxygenase [Candidatus Pelagibacter sp. HIMB1746]|uniref:putative 2OG-Fe(II) oxygenase n=1 Tax=Candidatus Pelagibacter sp. HIMB1746 TaxID=3413370 RepID=UPI003F841C79
MEIKIYKPFGPSICKVTIPKEIIEKLNSYIDDVIKNEAKSKELDYGNKLAGDVTQEFKLEEKIINESGWLKFLGQSVHEWIRLDTKQKIQEFKLIDSWVVRQFKNEYNPIHWHGGHVSGAGFLKVPETLGKYVQDKPNKEYFGGTLNFIHGSRQFMSNSNFKIIPKVGDFYFFPHYLMHSVYPFSGSDEERRSISFNANIDKNIFNVHGQF